MQVVQDQKAVDHGPQSPRQSPRYDRDSQTKSPQANFGGRVVAVEDGDTIVVLDDRNAAYKIRLQAIDAPEGGQTFGERSGQNLSEMVLESRSTLNGLSVIGIGESSVKY